MLRELASNFLRGGLQALSRDAERCSRCGRAPLAGELLHELASGGVVCELCLVRLPVSKRETVASQRVNVTDRPLAVVRRAA